MTRLSVNINKVALIRNARGGNLPDLVQIAKDCERYGAEGITVHPRPDERHITYKDVHDLAPVLTTEFNIEGFPHTKWMEIVKKVKPAQATLVPDPPDVITSSEGWDTIENEDFLKKVITELKAEGIRVSLFCEPIEQFIEGAKNVGADRIELYTGPYAENYVYNKEKAISKYILAAEYAQNIGLEINAGHDLNLDNLQYLKQNIPYLSEVSIGHALISDALYFGLENTIQMYLRKLEDIQQ